MEIGNCRKGIGQVRLVGATDFGGVVTPKVPQRKQSQLTAEEEPAIISERSGGALLFQAGNDTGQFRGEFLLSIRGRRFGFPANRNERQEEERAEKSHWS